MSSDSPSPSSLHARWKWLIVFLAAGLGSVILRTIDGRWPAGWSSLLGTLLATTLASFGLAMVFAFFIRGRLGLVVGLLLVALFDVVGGISAVQSRHEREEHAQAEHDLLLATLQQKEAADQATAREERRQAEAAVKAAQAPVQTSHEPSTPAKKLDPQSVSMVDTVVAVNQPIMKLAEEVQSTAQEIATEQFQSPANLSTVAEIQARLTRVRTFRDTAQQLLNKYTGLKSQLESELARRGIPSSEINDFMKGYLAGAHLEVSIPLARTNVTYADLLSRKFTLLVLYFGAWKMDGNSIQFDDAAAIREWNNFKTELLGLDERRTALEQQLLQLHEATTR